jgi:hypothetical protein
MGKLPKQIKSKEDRAKEGINILKQLRDAGVREQSVGFFELKTKISEWINGDGSWDGTIEFRDYGRIADVDLPKYDNRAAGINFRYIGRG